jgi:hypothetical protein
MTHMYRDEQIKDQTNRLVSYESKPTFEGCVKTVVRGTIVSTAFDTGDLSGPVSVIVKCIRGRMSGIQNAIK